MSMAQTFVTPANERHGDPMVYDTFNPWWGCSKVSPGCARCYAEAMSNRFGHNIWGSKAERRFFGDAALG